MHYSQMGAPPSDNIRIGLRVTIQSTECEIITALGGGGGEGLFCLGAVDCWLWGTTELLLVGTTDSSIVTLRLKHKMCWVGRSV